MRYLVLSDIHGGAAELKQALSYFEKYQCDFLVLLGDLLNHGPRNQVPASYDPPAAAALLNALNDRIISIRGNCDSEVDSMMFSFPCNAPYAYLHITALSAQGAADKSSGRRTPVQKILLTHGHLYLLDSTNHDESIKLMHKIGLKPHDIVLSGHTHVSGVFLQSNGLININPGSTTIPKGGTKAGFALILEDRIELRSLDNELITSYSFIFE